MFPRLFPLLVISLWGVIILPLPNQANAITPLTRAEIQNLRNLVQLIPRSQKRRPARKADPMIPGDGLSTGRASLADLRFNDGSLARIGEQAVFRFLPRTRNFRLSNGTVLLLIPPGRGQTRIQTPNAAAAIRGSALFVRYDQETDTTIVGALTNSGIEVSNQEASQNQVLEAGQLIVVVKGEFQGLYDFDLRNFYETSDLVRGLNLTKSNLLSTPDPAIASIQAEIAAALAAQSPITGEGVLENPAFLQLSANSSNAPSPDNITGNSPAESFVETGQILLEAGQEPVENNDNTASIEPPETQPPETQPPETQPPETQPPETQPPETQPPETQPPETQPPETQPPETQPPETQPPETQPPETQPPETQPPETQPPETKPPETQPPETKPPETQPPETQPPETKPPETKPPETQPPETKPPEPEIPEFINRLEPHFPELLNRLEQHFPELLNLPEQHFPEFINRLEQHFPELLNLPEQHFPELLNRLEQHFPELLNRLEQHFPAISKPLEQLESQSPAQEASQPPENFDNAN